MRNASLFTFAFFLFTVAVPPAAGVSFIPVHEFSNEPIPHSMEAEVHLMEYFSKNGSAGIMFDDVFRAETGFDYERYQTHQCFEIASSADQRICTRLFGPFADLKETFRSGLLFGMILRHSAAAQMDEVPFLFDGEMGTRATDSLPIDLAPVEFRDPLREDESMNEYLPFYDRASGMFYDPRTGTFHPDNGRGAPVYFREQTGTFYDPVTRRERDHHLSTIDARSNVVWERCLRYANGNGEERACYQRHVRMIHHEDMPALDTAELLRLP